MERTDRYMEAILGARLMIHYPLGSVKTDAQARAVDRITVRWARLAGRDPFTGKAVAR